MLYARFSYTVRSCYSIPLVSRNLKNIYCNFKTPEQRSFSVDLNKAFCFLSNCDSDSDGVCWWPSMLTTVLFNICNYKGKQKNFFWENIACKNHSALICAYLPRQVLHRTQVNNPKAYVLPVVPHVNRKYLSFSCPVCSPFIIELNTKHSFS